jgi:hypothetical protein
LTPAKTFRTTALLKPLESDMNTNTPALATVYDTLQTALAQLQAIDADKIESANLVPIVKVVQAIGAYQAAIDAQIQARAIGNGELIPGVVVKDSVVHRRWSDPEVAAQLAQETIGDKAFKRELLSPAQMEKLGDEGKSFVAVASFKPEAGKRVVY